jgi:REP element-mobilizing transposase RayT
MNTNPVPESYGRRPSGEGTGSGLGYIIRPDPPCPYSEGEAHFIFAVQNYSLLRSPAADIIGGYNYDLPGIPMADNILLPHRRSVRLYEFDYSHPGAYFITILAINRSHIFGKINGDQIELSPLGQIVDHEWHRLELRFPQLQMGAWAVMPNHVHGIIFITAIESGSRPKLADGLRTTTEKFGSPVSGSIPTIIRSYKSSVTQQFQWLTRNNSSRVWHRGYYDHVIRDEDDLENVQNYILNNPLKWSIDENNT